MCQIHIYALENKIAGKITDTLSGFLHLKSELIRRKGMQISVIIASNFHPEKFIILISLSKHIIPKSKEK